MTDTIAQYKQLTLVQNGTLHLPKWGDVRFGFSSRAGVRYKFARNVHVHAPKDQPSLAISLAINEQHNRLPPIVEEASHIAKDKTRRSALLIVEHMRHALFDFSCMPEHVHNAVIANMGLLALAHTLTSGSLLTDPTVATRLYPVAVAYDQATLQQHHNLHAQYMQIQLPAGI